VYVPACPCVVYAIVVEHLNPIEFVIVVTGIGLVECR
jgi:hypothetical protein